MGFPTAQGGTRIGAGFAIGAGAKAATATKATAAAAAAGAAATAWRFGLGTLQRQQNAWFALQFLKLHSLHTQEVEDMVVVRGCVCLYVVA
jgi:hypothetical protein